MLQHKSSFTDRSKKSFHTKSSEIAYKSHSLNLRKSIKEIIFIKKDLIAISSQNVTFGAAGET